MRIIAYTIEPKEGDRILLEDSTGARGDSGCVTELLEWMSARFSEPVLRVCWDLDATVAPILRLLGEEHCRKLYQKNKCYHRPYSIFYIPGKVFSIKPVFERERANLYDLEQYFPDIEPPRGVMGLVWYGNKLLAALLTMKLYPTKLTSPVAIWEQCVMNHLSLPTAYDMPQEAAEYAWYCSGKLWTEAYQIGYWEKAWDYDIIASFPSIARDLIDIRNCNWVKDMNYRPEAYYGYCRCRVVINEDVEVSPVIYQAEDGSLSTPTGIWETYLTKGEIEFIWRWKLGTVLILDGWWCIPSKISKPLQTVMNRLLAYKESDDELVRLLAKRMSVGIYGKFGEEHREKFGKHFNPCWFAEISTQVRLQVAEFIYRHKLQPHLIHVSVDGCLLDCPMGYC